MDARTGELEAGCTASSRPSAGHPVDPGPRETHTSSAGSGERLEVRRGAHGEVVLTGEIDECTAGLMCRAVDAAAMRDAPVILDLRGVRYLNSAGVLVLHELARDTDLHIRVTPDTAVATVLRICGFTHHATVEFLTEEAVG